MKNVAFDLLKVGVKFLTCLCQEAHLYTYVIALIDSCGKAFSGNEAVLGLPEV